MNLGFIGAKRDVTDKQLTVIRQILFLKHITQVHHGDVWGCEIIHCAAREFNKRVVVHPPISTSMRIFCDYDEIYCPTHYMTRNIQIIDASNLMIFAPMSEKVFPEVQFVRKQNKPYLVVFPDGKIVYKDVLYEAQ